MADGSFWVYFQLVLSYRRRSKFHQGKIWSLMKIAPRTGRGSARRYSLMSIWRCSSGLSVDSESQFCYNGGSAWISCLTMARSTVRIAKYLPANKPRWGVFPMVEKHLHLQSMLLCSCRMMGALWGGTFVGEFEGWERVDSICTSINHRWRTSKIRPQVPFIFAY